jgi:hypothetical protein
MFLKKLLIVFVLSVAFATTSVCAQGLLTPWCTGWDDKIPHEPTVKALKDSMIYFKKDGRCYAAIPYLVGHGKRAVTITQINCTEDIK